MLLQEPSKRQDPDFNPDPTVMQAACFPSLTKATWGEEGHENRNVFQVDVEIQVNY